MQGEETVVSAEWPLVYLPDTKIAALYFLNSNGLGVLLHEEISDEKLTNGLIIFNKPQHADLLYEINGWDRRALRLHTLSLGLRHGPLMSLAFELLLNLAQYPGTASWM